MKKITEIGKSLLALPLVRTACVGGIATVLDIALLVFLVQACHYSPQQANLPTLLLGSIIQFFGNRYWVFDSGAQSFHRQLLGFATSEMLSLGLNWLGFWALVTWTPVYYPLARPLTGFLVFIGFSYPSWRFIFRHNTAAAAAQETPVAGS